MSAERIKENILCLFFPKRCCFCGKVIRPEKTVCSECEDEAFRIEGETCLLCGYSKQDCICKGHKNAYSEIYSPFYYELGGRKAVLRLKDKGVKSVAERLAKDMYESVMKNASDKDFDEIAFVPMTKRQLKSRPANQSELLARELSKLMNIPVRSYLVKLSDVPMQHTLNESKRKGNVLGIFDVTDVTEDENVFSPQGKSILLCDDVKTTGATLNECAKMLKLAGAKRVCCVTATVTKKRLTKGTKNDNIG